MFGKPITGAIAALALKEVNRGEIGVQNPFESRFYNQIRCSARKLVIAAADAALISEKRNAVLEAGLSALYGADLDPYCGPLSGACPFVLTLSDDSEWLTAESSATADSGAFLCCPQGPDTTLENAEFRASLWLPYGLRVLTATSRAI